MQLHTLKKEYKTKKKKRIGRGGKRGTYSGKGIKGQKSRAGANIRPAERDYIIKLPKLRGVKFKPVSEKPAIVNIVKLEKYFKEKEIVSPISLLSKGLIRRKKGRIPQVKILGLGETKKKLIYQNCIFSNNAANKLGVKIEKQRKPLKKRIIKKILKKKKEEQEREGKGKKKEKKEKKEERGEKKEMKKGEEKEVKREKKEKEISKKEEKEKKEKKETSKKKDSGKKKISKKKGMKK
jgi:large subunit ribosomal protein L15